MNSLYLVLDMQNDLVHPEGASGASPLGRQIIERDIIMRTTAAIARARSAGCRVGFVRVAFSADHREIDPRSPVFGPIRKNGILKMGSWGAQVHESLGATAGDWDVVKHRVSPFFGTALELLIRTERIERIYCSGVSTQAVVQAAIRDGHDRDLEMVLFEDCCAAHSAEEHRNSIASLGRFCTVTNSELVFK
ncbi:MAG: cysteine hydrolase family protein [Steroidobacteraceae bacterium]